MGKYPLHVKNNLEPGGGGRNLSHTTKTRLFNFNGFVKYKLNTDVIAFWFTVLITIICKDETTMTEILKPF